ncbi:MAG: hypothetical protein KDC92_13845 [Bacteroidetes bacterium]|nr:hypothetical protein [Bacteroidota bacterium]
MGDQVAEIGLNISYILFGLAVLGAVFSAVRALLINPKAIIMALIFVAAFVVVYFIAGSFATNEVTDKYKSLNIDENLSEFIGTLLNVMWIMLSLTVLAVIARGVKSLFN